MTSAIDAAREVLEVVPLVMRTIRAEMRSHRGLDLTVAQFRALLFIHRQSGTPLAQLADFLGMTAPSASRMVDGLVERRLVVRADSALDRRRLALGLTAEGQDLLDRAREGTLERLAQRLDSLSASQRGHLLRALEDLRPAFAPSSSSPEAS